MRDLYSLVSGNLVSGIVTATLGSTSDKIDNLAAALMHPRSARNKTVWVVSMEAGEWTEN